MDPAVGTAALFIGEGTPEVPDHPSLCGGQCNNCGRTVFPLQHYGCEACGSQNISPKRISGRGKLVASAIVHLQPHQHIAVPYTVGSIVTDDGAVVRSILDVPVGTPLRIGTVMVTKIVPQTRPDRGSDDLRFVPIEGL